MTNLEQLVPPFELCRKIPDEAFQSTALIWFRDVLPNGTFRLVDGYMATRAFALNRPFEFYPAPTAQEILEVLQPHFPHVSCGWRTNLERNVWCYTCTAIIGATESCRNGTEFLRTGENLPEVLLKLWLDVRRVENG